MRVGIIRTDLNRIYLSDVENTSQRNFSSEPPGQSRYLSRPTDTQLETSLTVGGYVVSLLGTVTGSATKVTNSGANVLRIRTSSSSIFTPISVTSSATLANATLVSDLNAGFVLNGLPLIAKLGNLDNQKIQIETTVKGPTGYIELDTSGNGSTLNAAVGWGSGASLILNGLKAATLRAAVNAGGTAINVAAATIVALSTTGPASALALISNLTTSQQNSIVAAVQDTVAPKVIETGRALLSFDRGVLSKLRSASFQPGGSRSGLPAGVAAVIVANDGSTVFSV